MRFFVTMFFLLQVFCPCKAQKPVVLQNDQQITILSLIWDIDSEDVYFLGNIGDVFYKAVVINDDSKAAEPETDIPMNRIVLLKGELGEARDGQLFDLGSYSYVRNVKIDTLDQKIIILWGYKNALQTTVFDLP